MKCYFLLVLFICYTIAQNTNSNDTELVDPNHAYCLRFTWLGPEYDNSSNFNNATCGLLLEDQRSGIPCRHPLVVTYTGTQPDLQYLWQYHKDRVACRMARGQVCAKYSYSFNNEVQNITYMCTKVSSDSSAVKNGCYSELRNGYTVEVCVCTSANGLYLPCNKVSHLEIPVFLIGAAIIFYLFRIT